MSDGMKCTVCQQKADTTVFAYEFQGEVFVFCCPYCRERFIEKCKQFDSWRELRQELERELKD
jgi:hypothetical protein